MSISEKKIFSYILTEPTGKEGIGHTSDILKLPDAEIYYEITGSGPPLIFAHGLGGNHISWFQQVPYFAEKYTCIVFSHRGFTSSPNISGNYGPRVFADDLSALIDHLELKNVNLVAQSMGGWTALNYALRNNSKLCSLVLASSTGELDFKSLGENTVLEIEKWETESETVRNELKSQGLLPSTGGRMSKEQPAMNLLYRQMYDLTPNSYKDNVRTSIRAARVLSSEKLKQIKIPVLFIAGAEDIVFPPAAAVAASSFITGARIEIVPEAGHSVYFEKPDVFNKLVEDFLNSANTAR